MQVVNTVPGKTYAVEAVGEVTVTNADTGAVAVQGDGSGQEHFTACGLWYEVSDDTAAIVQKSGGSFALAEHAADTTAHITTDERTAWNDIAAVKNANSIALGANANFNNGSSSIAIGNNSYAKRNYATAVGAASYALSHSATAVGGNANASGSATAIGANSKAVTYSTALGFYAEAESIYSTALGYNTKAKDPGLTVISARNDQGSSQTILYLIGADSTLATTYEDGEACLGYVTKDIGGNILAAGTRKLSELLTNNTTFAPASLDPEAEPPKVFLPTGATDPIECPESPERGGVEYNR